MSKMIDMTGKKFGRLTVINRVEKRPNGRAFWHCECDCGNKLIVIGKDLRNGNTKSCGCLRKEAVGVRFRTHGQAESRLYYIWLTMKQRCENPNSTKAKDYCHRGITICREWHSFEAFQEWALANGYAENLTIDRIDNNKDYSPDNCRWTDNKTQANNRRSNVLLTFNGITQTIAQWAEQLGIKFNTLQGRIKYLNWSVERALTTSVGRV
jgi:hypothetical protein